MQQPTKQNAVMASTKLFHPYLTDKQLAQYGRQTRGRAVTTLKRTGAGVYFIYEKNWLGDFKLVYIGYASADVKSTMYRHFQKWNDKRHPDNRRAQRIDRVTYYSEDFKNTDYKCRVIFCNSASQAEKFERALIRKNSPRDNSLKIAFDKEVDYLKTLKAVDAADSKQFDPLEDLPF